MSRTATPARIASARARTVELVLAHTHLRLGSLALARVELETLAGLDALDALGMIDLAEVRWRTGDLHGAGEMAAAALHDEEGDPVALIIASEAAAALGRPTEARRLASLAIARAPDSIDAIFAGMPRSGVWPTDAAEPAPTAPTLFDRGPENMGPASGSAPAADEAAPGGPLATTAAASMTPGFWDADEVPDPEAGALPDPARELEAGRAALVAGVFDEAALRLGLALRLAPALAPAVLEATEGARTPGLTIVRGDAYRLAGYETEARRAYAVAARGGLPERRTRVRVKSRAKPSTSTREPAPEEAAAPTPEADEPTPATDAPTPAETDESTPDADEPAPAEADEATST